MKKLRILATDRAQNKSGDRKTKAKRRPETYYNQVRSIGNRLRDYHTWRNARLLDPALDTDRKTPARVNTDVIILSMQIVFRCWI